MKLVIVDDNVHDTELLTRFIQQRFDEMEIYSYNSGEEFLGAWEKDKFDIVILDIFIGDKNGMDIARIIRQTDSDIRIVFVSASGEFAGESYEVDASYYLHKPYSEEQIDVMLGRLDLEQYKNEFITLSGYGNVKLRNILYIENKSGTTVFHLKDNPAAVVRIAFSKADMLLNGKSGFYRLSDNLTVNFAAVMTCKDNIITMSDKSALSVPKRKAKEISAAYTAYCFEKLRKGGDM